MPALDLSVVGRTFQGSDLVYNWRTCALYALGVGAGNEALDFLWEGSHEFRVFPSFVVVPTMDLVFECMAAMGVDLRTLVHGEQTIRLHRPFAPSGTLRSVGRIPVVHDKGKAAIVVVETETRDEHGNLIAEASWPMFCRGQGGFGGDPGSPAVLPEAAPGSAPAFTQSWATSPAQSLLYRLSGDFNPLHVDPALGPKVGFERPILHGLCTYGFATRAVVMNLCGGDPARLKRLSARFSGVVYPGDTIDLRAVPSVTPGTFLLEARVGDRPVLSNGVAELA